MDFTWTPEQVALRHEARAVAASAVERFGRHADSWINGYSKEFARELAARGWIGMTWPESVGGGGRPPIDRLIVGEELIAAGAPIAAMWFADRQMGPTLIDYGRPDQQAAFLPGMLAGETTWCIGMSEPDAGSDLAGLQTSAVRDGDEWVINGQKIWTSFGAVADYCYVICRTRSDGPPHAGISEIIVPMTTPGIEVRPITDLTGNRHFCEVFFHDVRVPVDEPRRHRGWRRSSRRCASSSTSAAGSTASCRTGRSTRSRWNAPTATTRSSANGSHTSSRSTDSGGSSCCGRSSARHPAGFSAATKCFCTEHEVEVAEFVAAVLGMDATAWDPITAGIVYAPAYTIMGGTSNVMRNIVAERLLGLPR